MIVFASEGSGLLLLDAPISGGAVKAAAGTLTVLLVFICKQLTIIGF